MPARIEVPTVPESDAARRAAPLQGAALGSQIPFPPDQILARRREGDSLVLELADGREVVIRYYFAAPNDTLAATDAGQVPEPDHASGQPASAQPLPPSSGQRVAAAAIGDGQPPASDGASDTAADAASAAVSVGGGFSGISTLLGGAALIGGALLLGGSGGGDGGQGEGGENLPQTNTPDPGGSAPPVPPSTPSQPTATNPPASTTAPAADPPSTPAPPDTTTASDTSTAPDTTTDDDATTAPDSSASSDPPAPATPAEALSRLLTTPESLTPALARTAGLTGVTDTNHANIATVIAAELQDDGPFPQGLALDRLQALVDTVNELILPSETILAAAPGSLRLDIDVPDDGSGDVDRVVYIQQTDSLRPAEARIARAVAGGTVDVAAIEGSPDSLHLYDQIVRFAYDDDGHVTSKSIDDSGLAGRQADGSVDRVERYAAPGGAARPPSSSGLTDRALLTAVETHRYEDVDGDGSADRRLGVDYDDPSTAAAVDRKRAFVYGGAADTAPSRVEVDDDADGHLDGLTEYFRSGGALLRVRASEDLDDDGTFDRAITRYYDTGGTAPDYTLHDGTGTDSRADGTGDWLVYRDGTTFRHAIDAATPGLAGVQAVQMAGMQSATTLVLSDAQLTALADGASGYRIIVDGDADDTVAFTGDAIYSTGVEVNGRTVFQGSGGAVHVATDIAIEGALDPLQAALAHLDAATLEMFGLIPGVAGVTASSLDTLKLAMAAFASEAVPGNTTPALAALTAAQVAALASIASRADVVPAGAAATAAVLAASNTLALSISTDADPLTAERTVELELDPSTLLPTGIVRRYDADGNGTADDRAEYDTDADGAANRIETAVFDGDGVRVATLLDATADGTPDRLVFTDGLDVDMTLTVEQAEAYSGILWIEFAGGSGGDTDLTISRQALAALAGGSSPYTLVIEGDSSDSLTVTGMTLYPQRLNLAGRQPFLGSGNTQFLVDPEVHVSGGQPSLDHLLLNVHTATPVWYRAADITGVTDGNLDSLRQVLMAYGPDTTPSRYRLTRSQLQALVDIVSNPRIIPPDRDVADAALDTSGNLVLDLNASGVDTVTLDLDPATLAPQRVERWFDTEFDGTANRLEVDAEADGTYETMENYVYRLDVEGRLVLVEIGFNGEFFRAVAYAYDSQDRLLRLTYDDSYDGRRVDAERTETYAYDDDGSVAYIHYDGSAAVEEAGTHDRLEFADGVDFAFSPSDTEAAAYRGLRHIDMAGGGGETSITFTDAMLAALADGDGDGAPDAGYVLTVDGDDDDTVALGSGFTATGAETDGRFEFQSASGSVHVASEVPATLQTNPLQAILDDIAAATYTLFRLSLDGATRDNWESMRQILEAFDATTDPMRAALTLAQAQTLADIVTTSHLLPQGAEVIDAAYSADGALTLEIDTDGDDAVERRSEITLDPATLAPTGVEVDIDSDGDGTWDDGREIDRNADGTLEERVNVFYAADGATVSRVDRYVNADGTGSYEELVVETWQDGVHAYSLRSAISGQGQIAPQAIEFADGVSTSYAIPTFLGRTQLAGLDRIDLAGESDGANGATTLRLADSDITALADGNYDGTPDGGYVLVVRGDANDTVEFAGSGIAKTGDSVDHDSDSNTPALVEYTATDGIIYVDPEVTVDL